MIVFPYRIRSLLKRISMIPYCYKTIPRRRKDLPRGIPDIPDFYYSQSSVCLPTATFSYKRRSKKKHASKIRRAYYLNVYLMKSFLLKMMLDAFLQIRMITRDQCSFC